MKKIFAYDLDGTLLTSENDIHPYTKKIVVESHKKGNVNIVATGRGIKKVMPLYDKDIFTGFDYLICSNGAYVYDVNLKQGLTLGSVQTKAFDVLEKIAKENQLILTLDTNEYNGTWIPAPEGKLYPDWMNESLIMDMNILNRATLEELRVQAYKKNITIFQIALRNPINVAKKITKQVSEILGKTHAVFLTNGIYTDVCPFGVSKYKALESLIKNMNLSDENLYAFGDSGNDIDMLKNAKIGFAMSNATHDAKEAADVIIGDHNSGAIGETVEKFM
ncbi:Cof-type HAD-IIB family hydrolase [Mycoplasmopsis alligatoris]|uniref:HAD hydrolase, family IIB n=1 Tax=Mycoplasmopsis alligatoris A21JP2 TaxID=747682 RepID=D4XWI3_9BACT|nr:Cof-type HAD-IIB family hydrolase [Mycoplasmopsis alligatoris]EFF41339.1 HAD hydrolase, family IIB [Mycoplasmopsis alligatoris A21JP2]